MSKFNDMWETDKHVLAVDKLWGDSYIEENYRDELNLIDEYFEELRKYKKFTALVNGEINDKD